MAYWEGMEFGEFTPESMQNYFACSQLSTVIWTGRFYSAMSQHSPEIFQCIRQPCLSAA